MANGSPSSADEEGMCGLGESRRDRGASLSVGDIFLLLSEERRRYALHCLAEYDSPTALADVAADVAAMESDSDDVPAERIEQVSISLHHAHIPVLVDHDVVAYDADNRTIVFTDEGAPLVPYLEQVFDEAESAIE